MAAVALTLIGAAVWFMLREEAPSQERVEAEKPQRSGLAQEAIPAKAPDPIAVPAAETAPPAPKPESLRDPGLSDERHEELYVRKLMETPIPEESTNRLFRTALE